MPNIGVLMSDCRENALNFLKDQGLFINQIDADKVLADFKSEMDKGLTGRKSSLAMIPTYIAADKSLPMNKPVIAIDAGGTNLRVAVFKFGAEGKSEVNNYTTYEMPGSKRKIGKESFFNRLVEYILPVAKKADAIGFCFSYKAEISPDCDGKLLKWSKEIKAPEVVGEYIAANIKERLQKQGYNHKIIFLNDSVATLLAGKSIDPIRNYETFVGFILGTGTNTAYIEQNNKILKHSDLLLAESQAINVESGEFSKAPRSKIDKRFDKITAEPGHYPFEKMISGAYLGGLCLMLLKDAADTGLFSENATKVIGELKEISTIEVGQFLRNPFTKAFAITDDDRATIVHLFSHVVERAAYLTAINISAGVLKSGGGKNILHPVGITVDGSTFYKIKGFQALVEYYLKSLLTKRGIYYELLHVENAPLLGAAVAGLTN
jgi:hexokinase